MISNIGWKSLKERGPIARQTLMDKIVHGVVDISTSPLLPNGCQSPHHSSHLPYLRLQSNSNCYRSSVFPCIIIPEWNSLPLTLRSATSTQSFPREARRGAPSGEVYNLVAREARVYHTSIARPAWFPLGYKSIEFGWCPPWRHPE